MTSLVVAFALGSAGLVRAESTPPAPVRAAPSQYVEVVPTAGGGRPQGSASHRTPAGEQSSGPDSAVGAAADAVASSDTRGALTFAAVIVTITFGLVGAAAWR